MKAPGQPPSPLIQQVSSRKKGQPDEPSVSLHAKSSSLSSLLVNNEETTSTSGMVNGLTDFTGQRGHQELSASSSSMLLDRQSIIDMQKDIQLFTVATTELKEIFNKGATGKIQYNSLFYSHPHLQYKINLHTCVYVLKAFLSFMITLEAYL